MRDMLMTIPQQDTSLGVLIPTRDRAEYLAELLNSLMPQTLGLKVNVYIGDNCSNDHTGDVVRNMQVLYPNLFYQKNVINIGGDANFLMLVHGCTDDYFWLFGDDEVLQPLAIPRLMKILQESPDYVVFDGIDSVYTNVNEYISNRFKVGSEFLASCTLITANVVKRSIFNINFASTKYSTHYGHMYAIFNGLSGRRVKIVSCENTYFIVRQERAQPVDGDWPAALELEWHKYLRFLADSAAVRYPWLELNLIYLRRRVRHTFGNTISRIIGKSAKNWLKKRLRN